jgi:multicomponent Na+:H+ antiporter subunit D
MTLNWSFWLPQLLLGASFLTALLIFPLGEEQVKLRTALNLGGAIVKLILVGILVGLTLTGYRFETRLPFLDDHSLILRVDFLSLLFISLSAVLWLLTTIYAIGYLEHTPNRSRFFGFFSLCVTATMGIALAGNLLTFFVFYEMLSVVTYPLVVQRGTGAALRAGRAYLLYTLTGGTVLLLGIVLLHLLAGPVEFGVGPEIVQAAAENPASIRIVFFLLIAGLGVKAALFPLHGWLPMAMVAPAPVSALLHAVAVVKAGVFGIVRVVYDVFGAELAASLGLLAPLAAIAAFTILYGSVRALSQDDLKRRLAFSTISQLSYITLGVATAGAMATTGALVHLIHQGIMKVTLFFCAGLLAETLRVHKISEMRGIGRRMPLTMGAFTIAALGMIGVPPVAGFVSKWYLGIGGIDAGHLWVVVILGVSSVLNAMYFLPIIAAAWFHPPETEWAAATGSAEADWMLLGPTLVTGILSLVAGLLAGLPFSPLWLARLATGEMYGP